MAGRVSAGTRPRSAVHDIAASFHLERRRLPLAWGLLATCIVFGVLAMHSLAGGQHTAHSSGDDVPAAASHAGHTADGAAGAAAGGSVAYTPAAADTGTAISDTGAPHPQPIADCGDGCGATAGATVCLALLLSLALLALPHRAGSWAVSGPDLATPAAILVSSLPVLRPPSPVFFGISRT